VSCGSLFFFFLFSFTENYIVLGVHRNTVLSKGVVAQLHSLKDRCVLGEVTVLYLVKLCGKKGVGLQRTVDS